jgi:hypothetical protein
MLLPCLTAYGQQGYIDYDRVVQSLPGYLSAQKIVDARTKHWQDSIEMRIKAFTDNERPHNRKLNPSEARALEDTIHAMQVNIEQFQAYARREIKKVEEISDAQGICQREIATVLYYKKHPLCSRYGFDIILFWMRRLHGGFSGFLGKE